MNMRSFLESNCAAISLGEKTNWKAQLLKLVNFASGVSSERFCDITWEKTRLGTNFIPVIHSFDQQFVFNSRYDPENEANKIIREMESADIIFLIGFEAGYLSQGLCALNKHFKRLVCIDIFPQLIRQTLEYRDLSQLFSDPRFSLYIIESINDIPAIVAHSYQTHFYRTVRTYFPKPIQTLYDLLDFNLDQKLAQCIHQMQTDFITQAKLGKRWLYNIAVNLRQICEQPISKIKFFPEIAIIGAGPSVETQLDTIRKLQKRGVPIFITDAAISWCDKHHIKFYAVLSIDGQSISYIHLLQAHRGISIDGSLSIFDLCAHPIYSREGKFFRFMISGHPLLRYLSEQGLSADFLNTEGGNVGHSLFCLVEQLRPSTIHVFGLDFAYTNGKPYLRPSFFYSDALSRSLRTMPFEQIVTDSWLGQDTMLYGDPKNQILQTQRLLSYAKAFRETVKKSPCTVISFSQSWEGNKGSHPDNQILGREIFKNTRSVSKATISRYFYEYCSRLHQVRANCQDVEQLYNGPATADRQILVTLLPLMAWYLAFILKNDPECTDISNKAFEFAVEHTIQLLNNHFPREVLS